MTFLPDRRAFFACSLLAATAVSGECYIISRRLSNPRQGSRTFPARRSQNLVTQMRRCFRTLPSQDNFAEGAFRVGSLTTTTESRHVMARHNASRAAPDWGLSAEVTSPFGATKGRSPPSSIPHGGVDFNYPIGQTGINLKQPTLRAGSRHRDNKPGGRRFREDSHKGCERPISRNTTYPYPVCEAR